MVDRVGLCNRALLELGNLPIQGEDAFGADHVLKIFDGVRDAILTAKPWRFARKTVSLTRDTAAPADGFWLYQYNLPGDRLGLPDAIWNKVEQHTFTDFEYTAGKVHTNAEQLWAKYLYRPDYSDWPSDVLECLVMAAKAEFAMALNEDANIRAALREDVWGSSRRPGQSGKLQEAATTDAQAEPGADIFGPGSGGPFVDVRGW
jgi:hypothetical protein